MSSDPVISQATNGVRCMMMRGGSSKGAYFVASDLPREQAQRDDLLLKLMGSPDPRQIDGIGGAHPLTSKVAIVTNSDRDDCEIEYLFLQLGVDQDLVSDRQNCGNLLAGVAPFAIERGLVSPGTTDATAEVRIHMLNTDSVAVATFAVDHNGQPVYVGDTEISGVPGSAAPIQLDFEGIGGSSCGRLLPSGNPIDMVSGVACTLVDNGMPTVIMQASDLGISGYESCTALESNPALRAKLEEIRLGAGRLMNLGDVCDTTVPKMTMVAPPVNGGDISTRTFIPHRCHEAIGVLGAVSVATAALLPGSVAGPSLAQKNPGSVVLEHPTGVFEAAVSVDTVDGINVIGNAGIIRTARKLMDGLAFPREY